MQQYTNPFVKPLNPMGNFTAFLFLASGPFLYLLGVGSPATTGVNLPLKKEKERGGKGNDDYKNERLTFPPPCHLPVI